MTDELLEQLRFLPARLGGHLLVSQVALLLGVLVSLPLALLVARRPRWQGPVLGVVNAIQTIPGLALLALMVPLLALVNRLLGTALPVLGFLPAAAALTLYSMLPVVRNTVAGIAGVDPALVEAARGVGMTPWQQLVRVELPLAAPVILAGVRTATVWVVATATLATPVGQASLGNYIFGGLQTRNWTAVLFGCAASAVLALLLDRLVGVLEQAAARRSRRLGLAGLAGLLLVFAGGLLPRLAAGGPAAGTVVIGGKPFTEQYVLSSLLKQVLEQEGVPARRLESLGSTVLFDALAAGQVDCYVDYSGTIWSAYMQRQGSAPGPRVLAEATEWLRRERGVECLGPLGFENAYALAMRRDRAEELGVRTIGDLARLRGFSIGGDYEFFNRAEWRAVREAYRLDAAERRTLDPSFLYDAVRERQVDVISAYSSDGRIAAFDLVVLEDPRAALPPYDAVLLLSREAAARAEVRAALTPLLGAIDVVRMREANRRVDQAGESPAAAALWLGRDAGLLR